MLGNIGQLIIRYEDSTPALGFRLKLVECFTEKAHRKPRGHALQKGDCQRQHKHRESR